MKFEELYIITQNIKVPDGPDERSVEWCDSSSCLGLAKQPNGAFELFIRGEPLSVSSPLVRRHLRHDTWRDAAGLEFHANRIAFPEEAHYQAVAAFIAEELFRNGLSSSIAKSFTVSEPIIEMALRRSALSEEVIVGLLGELRLLNVLLSQASSPTERGILIESWRGYRLETRDFVSGSCSVEVKTTRGRNSVHRVSGIRQVDPDRAASGEPEETLYLVSFGLRPLDEGEDLTSAICLPETVDELLRKLGPLTESLPRNEVQEILISRIREYGGSALGYDHDTMRTWPAYTVQYQQGFTRIYDMNDDNVRVLRLKQISPCDAVPPDSVNFEINLPDRVTGDINPELDIIGFARRFIAEAAKS